MREDTLPSPQIGNRGHHLRRVSALSISAIEIAATAYSNGRHPQGQTLSDFFTACATACAGLVPAAPTITFTPTAKTYSIATGVTAGPTLAKGGSEGSVTYTSATPAKCTVDPVTGFVTPIATGTSVITASVAASGGFLAATQTYTATVTA